MKKTEPDAPDSRSETGLDSLRRQAYLREKGINPREPMQLDLIFQEVTSVLINHSRFLPNDTARSALFTVANRNTPRKTFLNRAPIFHLHNNVQVFYTGLELRAEDDELVWMQILHYAWRVPLGEPFEFTLNQLLKDLDWAPNGRNYDRCRECLSRLKANEFLVSNSEAFGTSGAVSLIERYISTNDRGGKAVSYRVWIAKGLITLFAGGTFTAHVWETYRKLSPLARRMADYCESHSQPFRLSLERFQKMCGSTDKTATSFRSSVKSAMAELEKAGIARVSMIRDPGTKVWYLFFAIAGKLPEF